MEGMFRGAFVVLDQLRSLLTKILFLWDLRSNDEKNLCYISQG